MSVAFHSHISALLGRIYAFGFHGGTESHRLICSRVKSKVFPSAYCQPSAWLSKQHGGTDRQDFLLKFPACFTRAAKAEEFAGKSETFLFWSWSHQMLSLRCNRMADSPFFFKGMSRLWEAEGNTVVVFYTFSFNLKKQNKTKNQTTNQTKTPVHFSLRRAGSRQLWLCYPYSSSASPDHSSMIQRFAK